jgi:hypothetical protein
MRNDLLQILYFYTQQQECTCADFVNECSTFLGPPFLLLSHL